MQTDTNTAYIGLGSNLGDGKQILGDAWLRLGDEEGVELSTLSSPFHSDPVAMDSDRQFTNCVGRIETSLTPAQLLERLLVIEEEFGRKRSRSLGEPEDRSLDLDLLYYGDISTEEENLVVPHPRRNRRIFVLVPMAEIEPTFIDPVTNEDIVSICRRFYHEMREGTIELQKIERVSWEVDLPGFLK